MHRPLYSLQERDDVYLGVKSIFPSSSVHIPQLVEHEEALAPPHAVVAGKFEELKGLVHENLCEYVDLAKGKHDRLFMVSEHYTKSLRQLLESSKGGLQEDVLGRIAYQILSAVVYLSAHNIVHHGLTLDSVLLDKDGNVKLSDYGFHYVTSSSNSLFAYGDPRYMSIEDISSGGKFGPNNSASINPKSVLWSLGVILWELAENKHPFIEDSENSALTPQKILVEIYAKIRGTRDDADQMSRSEIEEVLRKFPEDLDLDLDFDELEAKQREEKQNQAKTGFGGLSLLLRDFISRCLVWNPKVRSTPEELLRHPYFSKYYVNGELPKAKNDTMEWVRRPYLRSLYLPERRELNGTPKPQESGGEFFTMSEIYFFWKLSGGDAESEIYAKIKPQPSINNLPIFVPLEKFPELYYSNFLADLHKRSAHRPDDLDDAGLDVSLLFDEEIHPISLNSLRARFESGPTPNSMKDAPVSIRETDFDYQRRRVRIFRGILKKFHKGAAEAVQELMANASIDIPPALRAEIWSALLGIKGTKYISEYMLIDTEVDGIADKQIDLDIPRCHQYHPLLASPIGHRKFKKILKAWVADNPDLAYWQGLDSTLSPFLSLNFTDEAKAFCCLQKFMQKYLRHFYQRGDTMALQEYLVIFRQVLAFHDPELATHLYDIDFQPDLYAIPWFLTAFTHIFPLERIYPLWDTILQGPDILPLFLAIAIMGQLRRPLLGTDFNSAINLFSNLPSIDIWECIKDAQVKYAITPLSTTVGRYTTQEGDHWWEKRQTLKDLRKELAPRIATHDLVTAKAAGEQMVVLDTRIYEEFSKVRYPDSVHIDIHNKQPLPSLEQYRGVRLVVVGSREDAHEFAAKLIRMNFPRVCVLAGGIDALLVSAEPLLEYEQDSY